MENNVHYFLGYYQGLIHIRDLIIIADNEETIIPNSVKKESENLKIINTIIFDYLQNIEKIISPSENTELDFLNGKKDAYEFCKVFFPTIENDEIEQTLKDIKTLTKTKRVI